MQEVVIGIDQSLTKTGFAVIDKHSLELVEYGTFTSKQKEVERLIELSDDLVGTILEYQTVEYKVVGLGIEGYAFNKKFGGGRVFDLAELGGVLKREVVKAGIPLHIITVQQHVKELLGKLPKPLKDKLPRIHKVNELYDLELRTGKTTATQDSDIADAVSIARYIALKF
jgi:Holliday junction resolvasome RuvABC endonuclease subunit